MKIRTFWLGVLLLSLICIALPAVAQEYHDIFATGYTCAYFGDGTNQIFLKQSDGNFELVTFEEASKGIATELAKQRKKLQTLNRQKKEITKNFSNEDLLSQLNKKIKKVKKQISLRESELRGLEDCRDDFRLGFSVFNFKAILGSRPDGSSFVSLLITTTRRIGKNNSSARAYCFHPINPTDDFYSTEPQVKNFTTNPCGPPFNGSCPNILDGKTRLGYLYFFDPVNPNNGEEVSNSKTELLQIFAEGFAGRPAKNDFDTCSDSP